MHSVFGQSGCIPTKSLHSVHRERAVSLLAASLSALALMLQQLRLNGSDLNSATLMRSIMQAYFLLATAPESFCAVAGQMGSQPRHPLLQVQQAVLQELPFVSNAQDSEAFGFQICASLHASLKKTDFLPILPHHDYVKCPFHHVLPLPISRLPTAANVEHVMLPHSWEKTSLCRKMMISSSA